MVFCDFGYHKPLGDIYHEYYIGIWGIQYDIDSFNIGGNFANITNILSMYCQYIYIATMIHMVFCDFGYINHRAI